MIHHGDALEVLRTLETASADAMITDPPAGIAFMGKAWDGDKGGRRQWIAWLSAIMVEARRVLKPGASACVWALPRTSHWTGTALEDAGFEVRDVVTHVQGQGFPKSKALLKPAAEHWILCRAPGPLQDLRIDDCRVGTDKRFNPPAGGGYMEHWGGGGGTTVSGRWPANFCMSHAEGCQPAGTRRVKGDSPKPRNRKTPSMTWVDGQNGMDPNAHRAPNGYASADGTEEVAAWTCVEGCPVALLDRQSGVRPTGKGGGASGMWNSAKGHADPSRGFGDTGTASRFFHNFEPFTYQPKASRRDRGEGNTHPTVKSTALMRHLCRLITPPDGLVLDPFAGSGSTGVAALQEGLRFVGIERDAESVETARRRLQQADPAQPLAVEVA